MQTIIMTVGTSLLTNRDFDRPPEKQRPWLGQRQIGDRSRAIQWISQTEMELVSAETNTLWQLDDCIPKWKRSLGKSSTTLSSSDRPTVL